MAVKPETPLQASIKKLIRSRGGYAQKNHGDMISEPGIADITACYRGLYLAIEVKEGDNIPSTHQGIHCRQVLKAGGISLIAWSVEDVRPLLDFIDILALTSTNLGTLHTTIRNYIEERGIDDGSKY